MPSLLSSDPDQGIFSQSSSPLQASSPPQIANSNGANGLSVQTNGVHHQDTPNGVTQQRVQQQEALDAVNWLGLQFPDVFPDSEPEPAPVPAPNMNGGR